MCDFSDYLKFYKSKNVKGRRDYRCEECLQVIEKGEQHEYAKGLWQGEFFSCRTCQACCELIREIGIRCLSHGELVDEFDGNKFTHLQSVVDFQARRRANDNRKN